jgi:hypothetical protein
MPESANLHWEEVSAFFSAFAAAELEWLKSARFGRDLPGRKARLRE